MKYEEIVIEKHRFEKRVSQFLDLISRMDDHEIERALGRLLDFMTEAKSEYDKAHIHLRGEILQSYLKLRKAGLKKQRLGVGIVRKSVPYDLYTCFPPKKFLEDSDCYKLRCATEAKLIGEETFKVMNQIIDNSIDENVRLLAP